MQWLDSEVTTYIDDRLFWEMYHLLEWQNEYSSKTVGNVSMQWFNVECLLCLLNVSIVVRLSYVCHFDSRHVCHHLIKWRLGSPILRSHFMQNFFLYWGKILRMISDLYLVGSTKMIGKLLYNLRISFIKKIFFFLNGSKLTTVTMYKIFWSGRSMSRDLLTHMYGTILSGLTPFFVEQVFLRDFLF